MSDVKCPKCSKIHDSHQMLESAESEGGCYECECGHAFYDGRMVCNECGTTHRNIDDFECTGVCDWCGVSIDTYECPDCGEESTDSRHIACHSCGCVFNESPLLGK